jgi:hypothetical protein
MAGDILPWFSAEMFVIVSSSLSKTNCRTITLIYYSEYHQDIEISSENWGSPTANVATTVLCTIYNQNTYKVSSISELVQKLCHLKAIWYAQQKCHQMAHMAVAQTGYCMGTNMLLCQIFLCVTSFITTLAQETDNNSLCTLVLLPMSRSPSQKKISFGSQYAVQAGAHSAMVGWNRWEVLGTNLDLCLPHSISDSILISFAHMSNTSYNPLTDTVTVQPGVHWGDAIAAIEPYGVSIVGGRARYCVTPAAYSLLPLIKNPWCWNRPSSWRRD